MKQGTKGGLSMELHGCCRGTPAWEAPQGPCVLLLSQDMYDKGNICGRNGLSKLGMRRLLDDMGPHLLGVNESGTGTGFSKGDR